MNGLSIYLLSVSIFFGLLLAYTWFWLWRNTQQRKARLFNRKRFAAVKGDSPIDDQTQVAQERGVEAIEKQFTVTRRVLVPLILFMMGLFLALPLLGKIPTTFVSLIAAVFTIGLGIAARPVLENAMAGLVISFSRIVSIGDTVEIHGFYGTVEDITVTHTTIKIWDWRRYVVPNSRMLQTEFVNLSLFDRYVWSTVDFWVDYSVDIKEVQKACLKIADRCPYRYRDGESAFWIQETNVHAIHCKLAVWTQTPSDAWQARSYLRLEIGGALHEMNAIPRLPLGVALTEKTLSSPGIV